MRYAVSLLLILVVCCAGCAQAGLARKAIATQYEGGYSRGQHFGGYYHNPLRDRLAVGVSLGNVFGHFGEAVDGFSHSEFLGGLLIGADAFFIFNPRHPGMAYAPRHGLELRIESYDLLLTEDNFDFGQLYITSTTLSYKVLWMPPEPHVFGFHFDVGIGFGATRFSRDDMLKEDDLLTGITTGISPDDASIFVLGGGVDFHLQPQFCLSFDYRIASVYVPVDWTEDGVPRSDIDEFDATNHQFTISLRYFF